MDVGAVGLPHMQTELYDVRISDPSTSKYARSPGGTCAKAGEADKERMYGAACRLAGHVFFPFVCELYGRLGEKAKKVIRQLAHFRASQLFL